MANELVSLRQSLAPSCITDLFNATVAAGEVQSVSTDSEARTADTAVKNLKACVKAIHDQRMAVTRKVDAFKKSLMTEEADICAVASEHLTRIQSLCTTYLNAQLAAQEAARKAEMERIAQANADAAENALLTGGEAEIVVPTEQPKAPVVSGVRAREYWGIRIVDPNAVPRAYCVPDETLIRAYMNDAKRNGADITSLHIDGVEFYKEVRV